MEKLLRERKYQGFDRAAEQQLLNEEEQYRMMQRSRPPQPSMAKAGSQNVRNKKEQEHAGENKFLREHSYNIERIPPANSLKRIRTIGSSIAFTATADITHSNIETITSGKDRASAFAEEVLQGPWVRLRSVGQSSNEIPASSQPQAPLGQRYKPRENQSRTE